VYEKLWVVTSFKVEDIDLDAFYILSVEQCFKYRISAIYRSAKLCTGYRIPGDIS